MDVKEFALEGIKLIQPKMFSDDRGYFTERFKVSEFKSLGIRKRFIQDNFSISKPGVLRGLHYQWDSPQGKLVTCVQGRVYDVVVDIRHGSPTYRQSLGIELSAENPQWLWVPPGFAHGFCVIGSQDAGILYKVDEEYNAAGESGILWNDPALGINWPDNMSLLSEKDKVHKTFEEYSKDPKFFWSPGGCTRFGDGPKVIQFNVVGDSRGSLVSIEGAKNIPFEIKRAYYIYGTGNGVRRGFHAHRDLRQVAVAVSGTCKFLIDDGISKNIVELNSPDKGLLLEGVIWREMFDFSEDCVLLVFANNIYDESDYIRDYSLFERLVKKL